MSGNFGYFMLNQNKIFSISPISVFLHNGTCRLFKIAAVMEEKYVFWYNILMVSRVKNLFHS